MATKNNEQRLRVSRRGALLMGAAGGLAWLGASKWARADEPTTPHFLIAIQIANGVDNSYLTDGRAPLLTEKNLKSNYLLQNDAHPEATKSNEFTPGKVAARTIHTPETNSTALLSPMLDPLWSAHKQKVSLINGVFMLRANDGHDTNGAYFWGNAEAGGHDIFPPIVGKILAGTPLESVVLEGQLPFSPRASNLNTSVVLPPGASTDLVRVIQEGPAIDESSPLWRHLLARADAAAQGGGLFAAGAANMASGLRKTKALGAALTSGGGPAIPTAAPGSLAAEVAQVLGYFSGGMTQVAMIVHPADVDLHDSGGSQNRLVQTYTTLGQDLKNAFDVLRDAKFRDANGDLHSFLDVTTIVITSEFGRTNKQNYATVGGTGTDHNAFSNSVIVGGKGIRGGIVIGESDLRACSDEGKYLDVSGAHKQKDPSLLHVLGKPFDFVAQRVRNDLPTTFDEREHLCMPSVTNTILKLFGVPEDKLFKLGAQSAPVLTQLLA